MKFETKILKVDPRHGKAKLSIRALKENVEKQTYNQYRADITKEAATLVWKMVVRGSSSPASRRVRI